MNPTVGIVRDPEEDLELGTESGLVGLEAWPQGPACEVLFSPPTPLAELAQRASLIILAVSAEKARAALSSFRGALDARSVLVCTSDLISLGLMRRAVGPGPSLVRAIVAPGAAPGEGVAALACDAQCSAERVAEVRASFAWMGTVEVMGEDALDAVAALALGARGFVCPALEGLEEGAVRAGLPRDTARPFVHQTALATALLLRDHLGSPADLKDQVASPGGTTIAALATLEDAGVRGAFIRAVQRSALEVRARRDAGRSDMIE